MMEKKNRKRNGIKKKVFIKGISYLLCLCLLISNLSLTAFASGASGGNEESGRGQEIPETEIVDNEETGIKESEDAENGNDTVLEVEDSKLLETEYEDQSDSESGDVIGLEDDLFPSEEEVTYEYYINPIYAQWYDPQELLAEARENEAARRVGKRDRADQSDATVTCTTNEEAIAYLRQQMVLWRKSITVNKTSGVTLDWSALLEAAMEDDGSAKGNEGDYIRYQYGGASGSSGSSSFVYNLTYYSTPEREREVNAHLEKVYEELELDSKTDIEKIDAIYSYVTNHAYYDYYALKDGVTPWVYSQAWSAWGNLIQGKSVCQGFAVTLYRMMKDNGIQSRVVTGPGHAWNIVEYDGIWYNMDSTWDCSTPDSDGNSMNNGKKNWYMCSSDDFSRHPRDEQFDTDDFHARYPMAGISYGKQEKTDPETLNANNYKGTFSTIDDGKFSVTASETDDMKVLIFGTSSTVINIQNGLSTFESKGMIGLEGVPIALIPIQNESKDTMISCKDQIGYDIIYCYDTTNVASTLMWNYIQGAAGISGGVQLPVYVIIDKNNKVRKFSFGNPNSDFYDAFDWILAETYGKAEITKVVQTETGNLITWEELTGAEGYNVYRAYKRNSEFRLLASGVTGTSYLDESVEPENEFWYKLEAVFKGKGTGKSAPVQATYEAPSVKEVRLNIAEAFVFTGETIRISAEVIPDREGRKISQKVTWSSDDETIVTIDETGLIKGIKPGETVVRALAQYDNKSEATCIVTVKEDYTITYVLNGGTLKTELVDHYNPFSETILLEEPVKEGFHFRGWYTKDNIKTGERVTEIAQGTDEGNITLYAIWQEYGRANQPVADKETGETVLEDSFILLETETEGAKIYYTLDGSEPTTESSLYVNGVEMKYEDAAEGKITLKAFAVMEGYKDSFVATYIYDFIEVVPVKEVRLDLDKASLFAGESFGIMAEVIPGKEGRKISQEVIWSSDDISIVSVDESGLIKGVKPGMTLIHAVSKADPKKSATCVVTIKEDYTITYMLNGGSFRDGEEPVEHYNPFSDTIQLPKPEKEDFAFLGWYTSNDMAEGEKVTEIAKGTEEGDITLYALWKELDPVDAPVASVETGEAVLEDSFILLESGTEGAKIYYTLDGTNPTKESCLYTADGIRMRYEDAVDGEITLKAIAVKEGYKKSAAAVYTYILIEVVSPKEILLNEEDVAIFVGESRQIKAEVLPDKEGRNVSQEVIWSIEDDTVASIDEAGLIKGLIPGKTVILATSKLDSEITAECTLTIKEDYKITYVLNGGTLEQEPVTHYNPFSEKIILEKPVKEGYVFLGWFTEENTENGEVVTEIAKGTEKGDITLYAIWVEIHRVVLPIADVKSGNTVLEDSYVHLATDTEDAEIYYTLDGSIPTVESMLYTEGILIRMEDVSEEKIIIKAFAVKKGYEDSDVATYEYLFKEYVPAKEVILNIQKEELFIGETLQLTAEVIPGKEGRMISQQVIWSSDNEWIVAVDEKGFITAKGSGNVRIRAASAVNPEVYAECRIYVSDEDKYGDILPEDIPEDGLVPKGVWVAGIEEEMTYTGGAITFPIRVYDRNKLMVEKKDYTVSYKNNKNAGSASAGTKAPTVTIQGRGNYTERIVKTFTINRKKIGDDLNQPAEGIYVETPVLIYNGKDQKIPNPIIMLDGAKLVVNKDYKTSGDLAAYKEIGTYPNAIKIEGIGNYEGKITTNLIITRPKEPNRLLKNATIDYKKSISYEKDSEMKPPVTVRFGKDIVDSSLYDVEYYNNTKVGTAMIVIRGTDDEKLAGSRTVTFKITGTPMSKVEVWNLPVGSIYNGDSIKAGEVRLRNTVTKEELEPEDYTISYKNNKNKDAGTVTVIFTGRRGYTGAIQKTYKIGAYDIDKNAEDYIKYTVKDRVPYAKNGSRPEVRVTFRGEELTEGKDYTLSYQNNKAVTDGKEVTKKPTVSIKGKGNFSGTIKNQKDQEFEITKADISVLTASAPDIVNKDKAGKYFAAPRVVDVDGKALKAGTDYDRNFVYYYEEDVTLKDGTIREEGSEVLSTDIIPLDTPCTIRVEMTGLGNYEGTVTVYYRIVKYDIARVKRVDIKPQEYNGRPIEPEQKEIVIYRNKINEHDTLSADDYEIVEYSGQVNKGKGYLIIRGKGLYGGMKKCSFNVIMKPINDSAEKKD